MAGDVRERLEETARLLSHQAPRQRVEGIRRLTALSKQLPLAEREAAIPMVEGAAEDKEAFVRWNLAFALGEIAHERGIPVLLRLSVDEHANVRFRAAIALALIGHERALPALERMAVDTYKIGEHYAVRAFAALALGRFPQEAAVRVLARLVEDVDPVVRWHAAVALGDIGLEGGLEPLAKLVEDPIPFVRAHTAIALAEIGHPGGPSRTPSPRQHAPGSPDRSGIPRIASDVAERKGGLGDARPGWLAKRPAPPLPGVTRPPISKYLRGCLAYHPEVGSTRRLAALPIPSLSPSTQGETIAPERDDEEGDRLFRARHATIWRAVGDILVHRCRATLGIIHQQTPEGLEIPDSIVDLSQLLVYKLLQSWSNRGAASDARWAKQFADLTEG